MKIGESLTKVRRQKMFVVAFLRMFWVNGWEFEGVHKNHFMEAFRIFHAFLRRKGLPIDELGFYYNDVSSHSGPLNEVTNRLLRRKFLFMKTGDENHLYFERSFHQFANKLLESLTSEEEHAIAAAEKKGLFAYTYHPDDKFEEVMQILTSPQHVGAATE